MLASATPVPGYEHAIALSVVVPCYNEAEGIHELHRRVTDACRSAVGELYELVLINDGSTDETWSALKSLTDRDPRVVAIQLARNYGHQIALSAGLQICRGERTLILDADLQDPPELLPDMMALMDQGYDVVYGQRQEREGETWFKRASAAAFYRFFNRLIDVRIPVDTGDFRLMSRKALTHLNAMPEQYRFVRGMVAWIGLKQTPIRYHRGARFAGETKYPLKKMLRFAVDAITSFSVRPLRFASHIGIAFGVLGLVSLGCILTFWLRGDVVPGWTSLAALVLILGSIQLTVLGVFGEYLGRMYIESKRRPLFIIDEIATSAVIAETHSSSGLAGSAGQPARNSVHEMQERILRAGNAGS
jgi:glycosyltransferase involved in cell wall biosynthesis